MRKTGSQFKTILWGTLIVSVVPSAFVFFKRWFLGTQDQEGYETVIDFIFSTLFSVVVTFSIFLSNFYLITKFTKANEDKLSDAKRIIIFLTLSLIASNLIMFVEWKIFNTFLFKCEGAVEREHIFENQLLATILVIIVSLVLEIKHYIDKLKTTVAENERLEREFIKAQLEGLKMQISPHFLFNSFNALQSLIEDNPETAKVFVKELASVYRYVLDKKDNMVVELSEEVNFMQSFVYLNKIRFGENLVVNTKIDSDCLNTYLPPLTLQLLIENAIKHNIISSAKPLYIDITASKEWLIVSNNYQPRTEKIQSTHIGLNNLTDRYKLITKAHVKFGIENTAYVAKVPLISQATIDQV